MKFLAECFCALAAALRFLSVAGVIEVISTASEPARKKPAHRRADDTIVKEARQPPPTATVIMGRGGLSSTASDYIRFVRMILNDASRTPVRPTIHGRLRNFRFEAIERLPAKFACPAYLGDFYRRIAVRYL
jgi:CubicO group peptidase (beta-lactamase class C family)